jgi:hypothetical protein
MLDTETLRVLLGKFEQGLTQCKEQEAAAMERRLRQEGAVLAVRQLLQEQEQAAQVIAVPLGEGVTDGSNT